MKNLTLLEIEQLLQVNQKTLRDYPSFPFPEGDWPNQLGNGLILSELNYNTDELKSKFLHLFATLTGNLHNHILSSYLTRNYLIH